MYATSYNQQKMSPPVPAGKPFEIAIIGGGITGITLAIALCKRNIRCAIYEQASAFGEIGAGVGGELPTFSFHAPPSIY